MGTATPLMAVMIARRFTKKYRHLQSIISLNIGICTMNLSFLRLRIYDRLIIREVFMFERAYVQTVAGRLKEPRRFIQIIMGPRQTGKSTSAAQALSYLDIPSIDYSFELSKTGRNLVSRPRCRTAARHGYFTARRDPKNPAVVKHGQRTLGRRHPRESRYSCAHHWFIVAYAPKRAGRSADRTIRDRVLNPLGSLGMHAGLRLHAG